MSQSNLYMVVAVVTALVSGIATHFVNVDHLADVATSAVVYAASHATAGVDDVRGTHGVYAGTTTAYCSVDESGNKLTFTCQNGR